MTVYDQPKQVPDSDTPPMQNQERDRIAAFLEGTVSAGASSEEVAEVIAAAFRSIDQILAPIIGPRGLAALYKRTLHLARPACPWLPVIPDGVPPVMDLPALVTELEKRTAADSAAAGAQLLQILHTLLMTLIGELLTEQLLRPVWTTFLSGPSARDTKT